MIGNPLRCGQSGCGEPATVMLRQFYNREDGNEILYCDSCWLETRRGYTPLVAHDAAQAIQGLSGGDFGIVVPAK